MTNVLIVEDSLPFQRWLRRTVVKLLGDCAARVAGTVDEAQVLSQDITPGVFILDLNLPIDEGDTRPSVEAGLGLLRKYRSEFPQSKIVMLSSYAELDAMCLDMGADAFVGKDDADLVNKLRTAICPA